MNWLKRQLRKVKYGNNYLKNEERRERQKIFGRDAEDTEVKSYEERSGDRQDRIKLVII